MRTFFGQEGGSIFRDFVRTSFMDSLLAFKQSTSLSYFSD